MASLTSISIPNFPNCKTLTSHTSSISSIAGNRLRFRSSESRVMTHRLVAVKAVSSSSSSSSSSESTVATEKLGISIITDPPESKLTGLGVRSWPKWGCPPSKFPWTYSSRETCYLLKGKVKIYPDGSDDKDGVEIGAGDLVVFPAGMSCTWDVSETVDKHYKFD